MKTLIIKRLQSLARRAVLAQKPTVIGITGSYGKTSTRQAVAEVLSAGHLSVRTGEGNYNSEIGFPLSVLGESSPGRHPFAWLGVLGRARAQIRSKTFPSHLVLEYGADKRGDIARLCDVVSPTVSVLTGISPVHAEGIGSLEDIVSEKGELARRTMKGGLVMVNADDPYHHALAQNSPSAVQTYGWADFADVRVSAYAIETLSQARFSLEEPVTRMRVEITTRRSVYDVTLQNVLGKPVASALAAAVLVGEHFGLSREDILVGLQRVRPISGRLNPLIGIKGSLIIDDSYNASPKAMHAALETLSQFALMDNGRRIAVLGHMAELGPYTESEHQDLGKFVAELGNVDGLLCVGERARDIARAARAAGMPGDHVLEFPKTKEAGEWVDGFIHAGDVVLVKGSQSARMEHVVKAIMAEPLRSEELLVRQSKTWLET